MPLSAGPLAGRKELVGKIKQQRHSIGLRYRDTEGSADQRPTMILINGTIPKIKRGPRHVTAAVVDGKKESARQVRKIRIGAESGVQPDHQWPDIDGPATDPGERRGNDVTDPLMGIGRQKPCIPYRIHKTGGHGIGQSAELHTSARGQL
jgi:hypothetical protein